MLNTQKKQKIAAAAILLMSSAIKVKESEEKDESPGKKNRSVWVRPWLQKRPSEGLCQKLLPEFRDVDGQNHLYLDFMRMDEDSFNYLLALVTPLIAKQDTNMRKSIDAGQRLTVTLRFLATGESFKSLSTLFRMAPCTISLIVPQVCDAIYSVLKGEYVVVSVWVNVSQILVR